MGRHGLHGREWRNSSGAWQPPGGLRSEWHWARDCPGSYAKGSAVIWLSRSLHGSGASKSSEGRVGYFHSYIVDWLRQEKNQYLSVPAEAARLLPLASRQPLAATGRVKVWVG